MGNRDILIVIYLIANWGVIPFWLLLIFLPNNQITNFFTQSIIPFLLLGVGYAYLSYKIYLENNILLKQSPLIVILDHIQDPQNLGSILRTSLGASVDAIIIPKDRACHLTPTVRKVSKAASEIIPVIVVSNLRNTVKMLQRNFIEIYACTGQADLSFFEVDFKGSKALIFGSEDKGIQKFLANEANEKIKIPIDSRLESLNVSNATSVILFEAKRQRN